jgi:hypothetical protein
VASLLQTQEPVNQTPTWNISSRTGFPDATSAAFGVTGTSPGSAIQLGPTSVGLWLNSCSPGTTARDTIQPLTLSYETQWDVRPFASVDPYPELAFRFEAAFPTLTATGGAVAYAAAVLRFRDKSKVPPPGQPSYYYDFWVSMQLADTRGYPQPEVVMGDACATCSGLPIVMTSPGGLAQPAQYMHRWPGTTGTFTGASTSSAFRSYDFRISRDEFQRMLVGVAGFSPRGFSINPADYALVHFNLNPEVYDPSPSTVGCSLFNDADVGTLGMSVRAISLSQVGWNSVPRMEYWGANAATNGNNHFQVFFQRSTDPFFDEPKSFSALMPADGGQHLIRFDLLGNPHWRDAITSLRVDPFNDVGSFNVDSLAIYGLGNTLLFLDDFAGDPNDGSSPWTTAEVFFNLEPSASIWDGVAGPGSDPLFFRSVGPIGTGR